MFDGCSEGALGAASTATDAVIAMGILAVIEKLTAAAASSKRCKKVVFLKGEGVFIFSIFIFFCT